MVINSQEILLLPEIQSVRLRVRRTSIEKTINFLAGYNGNQKCSWNLVRFISVIQIRRKRLQSDIHGANYSEYKGAFWNRYAVAKNLLLYNRCSIEMHISQIKAQFPCISFQPWWEYSFCICKTRLFHCKIVLYPILHTFMDESLVIENVHVSCHTWRRKI